MESTATDDSLNGTSCGIAPSSSSSSSAMDQACNVDQLRADESNAALNNEIKETVSAPVPDRGAQGQFAKVREEFLREISSWTQGEEDEDERKHHTGFRKRTKMMNQGHKQAETKLCHMVKKGLQCQFGSGCKFSHDVETYLKERPADLGEQCPSLDQRGYCPMGFSCRFVGAHPTVESFRSPAQADAEAAAEKHRAVIKKLNDGKYEFQGHHQREQRKKTIDLKGKVYVAPLTTVGNLPFRRVLVNFGADVTCGEMAMAYQLIRGSPSEWALLKRHSSEKTFGVQIAGCKPEDMAKAAELISRECDVDFIDVNMGCPIDDVTKHGAGSALMKRPPRITQLVETILKAAPDVALGLKMRTGWDDEKRVAHKIIEGLHPYSKDLAYIMVHGRSRLQRYTKTANWEYIATDCARAAKASGELQFVGNGDVLCWEDYRRAVTPRSEGGIMDPDAPIATALLARGALMKPWLCTEIKEQRVWDISASERLNIVKDFVNFGLDHWGSDDRGVDTTRRYLLEWLSFAFRYVPVGICQEGYVQHINHRPPSAFVGRSDLETLLASPSSRDWEKIAAMYLGPSPEGFHFMPKHKANAW